MESRSTFPLRFRTKRLRALVREVALREGISQNELLEQAAEHEVVARGALLAEDLATAAATLQTLADEVLDQQVERSLADYPAGEQRQDPLRAARISVSPARKGELGAVAAFRARRI